LFHPPAANGFLWLAAKVFSVLNRETYWYERRTKFSMSALLRLAAYSGLVQRIPNMPAINRTVLINFIFSPSLSV
jgi:hypothetical protein